jgi:hypothetical protein
VDLLCTFVRSVAHAPDESVDEASRWSWILQRPCMQAYNGGRGGGHYSGVNRRKLAFPGPRTGAAIWTAPCCVVGKGARDSQPNHKMCNAAKFKTLAGQCAHQKSDSVFMFGGIGLMESVARISQDTNPDNSYCLVDQPGKYVRDARQQAASWVQSNSSKSWLAALDWALYDTLCDLWQTDDPNRWSLLGACASGLRSPVNELIPQSFEVNAANPVPFPDALALAGVYKASTWLDDVGNLWIFGGYMGSPGWTAGFFKEVGREYSPGGTVCNHELWAYDPVQGGNWSHVRPAEPRPPNTHYLPADAGNLPGFTWPQLGKCGAIAWQPWHHPAYHDSGDPQVRRCCRSVYSHTSSIFLWLCATVCWFLHCQAGLIFVHTTDGGGTSRGHTRGYTEP